MTLDSPAIDKRQFKINEIPFLKDKILKKIGTCDFTIKKQSQLPDPHAKEFSSIVVRKVEVLGYIDCSSATAYLGSRRKQKQTKTLSFSKVSVLL